MYRSSGAENKEEGNGFKATGKTHRDLTREDREDKRTRGSCLFLFLRATISRNVTRKTFGGVASFRAINLFHSERCSSLAVLGTRREAPQSCLSHLSIAPAGVMDLGWKVLPLLLLLPGRFWCVSVHVLNEQPVHVIPGSKLVLTARIQKTPWEEISAITWEREPETGPDRAKVTLATCTADSPACSGGRPGVQMNLKQQETTLEIIGYRTEDGGEYSVTVEDQSGANTTGRCIVREYEAVHHVSVSINTSHSLLVCQEAWGTEPSFSWLHERAAITQQVGKVSKDGNTLVATMTPICGHFTCTVGNKLGYSSATYSAAPCESGSRGTTAAVVCLVLLLLVCGGVLAFLFWRRQRENNREERLYEHTSDTS